MSPKYVERMANPLSSLIWICTVCLHVCLNAPKQRIFNRSYRKDPKFSVWSGSTLFVCQSVCISWTHYSMVDPHCSHFRIITAIFQVSAFLGILRYILWTLTLTHQVDIHHTHVLRVYILLYPMATVPGDTFSTLYKDAHSSHACLVAPWHLPSPVEWQPFLQIRQKTEYF